MISTEHSAAKTADTLPLYLIGKNSRGQWVVRESSGRCGGLFFNRVEAIKFAMYENGHRLQAVVMVAEPLELDIGAALWPGTAFNQKNSHA